MNRRDFLALGSLLAAGAHRLQAQAPAESPGPIVATAAGRVRGVSDGAVHIFRGVPCGASTAGANRFQPPRPAAPWTGVRDTSTYGPRAYQPFRPMIPEIGDALTGSGPMSEDCLRVNVFTPGTSGRRPVMVWFHGGGQRTGSGNSTFYDGRELARRHDVVVVTTTHRLNAFAYLWLAGVPGTGARFAECTNLGLRDLVLALEWVRDNIARFGGDAGNVTIFGQSGGGGKTAMLTGFPAAKGLFHRAIIMSTLAETAVTGLLPERAIEASAQLLRRLDVTPAQASRLLDFPAERIVEALITAPDLSLRFVPVVDGATLPAHPFSPASPLSAAIPILTGSNECESIPYGNPDDPYWTSQPFDDETLRARVRQLLSVSDAEAASLIALYRSHRPGDTPDDLAAVIAGDASDLRAAAHAIAEAKHRQGRAPVFLYRFTWRSRVRGGALRSMHGMELPFVFNHPDRIGFLTGSGDDRYELARSMSAAWVAFARTGNPNHADLPRWNAWTPDRRSTMVFDRVTTAVDDPWGEERRAMERARAPRPTAETPRDWSAPTQDAGDIRG
jgi:para-nitrobenzyl esterase